MTLSKEEKQILRHALFMFEESLDEFHAYTHKDLNAYLKAKRKLFGPSPLDRDIEKLMEFAP